MVSTDLIGNRHAVIEDSYAIIVNKRDVVIYVRYDDAFGYICQVNRVAQKMAGVLYPTARVQPLIHFRCLKDTPNLKSVSFCWQSSALLFIISPRVRAAQELLSR